MKSVTMTLAAAVLAIGLPVSASAEDDLSVSFSYVPGGPVTITVTGLHAGNMYDEQTEALLKRAAELAQYAARQPEIPKCVKWQHKETGRVVTEEPADANPLVFAFRHRCIEREE